MAFSQRAGLGSVGGRVALVAIAASFLVLVPGAGPAAAHVSKPTDASHYRCAVTAITPAQQDFSVRVGRVGDWIELTAKTTQPLVVVGYFGEPYLRVTSAETQINEFSPTGQLNGGLIGTFDQARLADAESPPHWVTQSVGPTVRWRDLRTQWLGGVRPPDVGSDPAHAHLVGNWSITVQAPGRDYAVNGTLRWTPIHRGLSNGLIAFFAIDTVVLAAGAVFIRRRVGNRVGASVPAVA
jgi:hypothetical protein